MAWQIMRTTFTLILLFIVSAQTYGAVEYDDIRYCGPPARNLFTGRILRDRKQVYAFRKFNPCPVDGNLHKACPGWSVDHVRPLASCGCDDPNNLQWLDNRIKSCEKEYCKDRWERRVYVCKPEDIK